MSEVRSGPFASTASSRASSVPRSGSAVWRVSCSPARRPGKTSADVQATLASSPEPLTGTCSSLWSVPKTRVLTTTGIGTSSPCLSLAGPDATTEVAVAVVAAAR